MNKCPTMICLAKKKKKTAFFVIHWKETVVGSFNTNLFHKCILMCVTAGKNPQLGALDLQSPLQQRMHQPQRHRSEETDLQPTVLGTQNQRQEELQEELRTVVVTGPSLGPDHQELCSLYFENTKCSGGGDIQEDGIRWDEKRMCFCITFQDSQGWFLLHSLKCCCHLECMLCNNCPPPPTPFLLPWQVFRTKS